MSPIELSGDRLSLSGAVGLAEANEIHRAIAAAAPREHQLAIDLSDVPRIDTITTAAVIAGCRGHARDGVKIHVSGPPEVVAVIESTLAAPAMLEEHREQLLEIIGEGTLARMSSAGALASMAGAAAAGIAKIAAGRARLPRLALGDKVATMGADAVGIVVLLSALLGMILAFEASLQLAELGARSLIPDVVGLSLTREFAPLLVAVVVIARNGAAIASELSTMSVGQEVDALRTMGISPVQYLVVPRTLALLITTPVLTLIGMFVGLVGALGITVSVAELSVALFHDRLVYAVGFADLAFGLGKSVVFAATTGLAAAAIGLRASGSASDVGRATTHAVVLGILLLVLTDAAFSFISGMSR